MKNKFITVLVLGLGLALSARAQVPGIINYQGRVSVGGTNFNGTGQFEFALIDGGNNNAQTATAAVNSFDDSQGIAVIGLFNPGSGYTTVPNVTITDSTGTGAVAVADLDVTDGGIITNIEVQADGADYTSPTITIDPPPANIVYTTLWSNDGSSVAGSQTVNAVSLPVTKGLYSVLLGDTTISNMTVAVPASVFANNNVNLRVWFNDGVHGVQQLTPDQRLAAAGYALQAQNAAVATFANDITTSSVIHGADLSIGFGNSVNGLYASIAGGQGNTANGSRSFVGGGYGNTASGTGSFVGGGGYDGNNISGNTASGAASTVGGGFGNVANSQYATVGGGDGNHATGAGSFVGGGGYAAGFSLGNTASGDASTVAGGFADTASGLASTVGGGEGNTAGGNNYATVGGGDANTASGVGCTVSGGLSSIAGGFAATVPGGVQNNAAGDYSFAAGHQAKANHTGAFVWADSTAADFASTANNQFSARAAGGVRFFSNSGASLGAQLAPNATAWTTLSDRNAKDNIRSIDVQAILNELVAMPLSQWSYKADPTQRRYIGPMAQDFHSAFGLGDDDKRINTLDTDGVTLAAIQGLYKELQEEKAHNAELQGRLTDLETKLQKVSEQMEQSKAPPQSAANTHNQGGL